MELVSEWFPDDKFWKVNTPLWTEYAYRKYTMDNIPMTGDDTWKSENEYCGNFVHTL